MSETPAVGTIFEQPGFRGEVIAIMSGFAVVKARLDGAMPAHASETDEFAFVIAGEIIVDVDGRQLQLSAGQSILIPAGKTHVAEAVGSAELLLIG